MKRYIIALIVIIILAAGAWLLFKGNGSMSGTPNEAASSTDASMTAGQAPIATATYTCDKGKSISAAYYESTSTPVVAAGQPPVPTGSIVVSFDGAASTTLHQTLSADGARYATADDSFVFWNKGNEALIMRNNSMDLDYTNCMDNTKG